MPFSCATTAASAVLGPIFPPSIPFVIYAMVSGASVGKLFLGGMVPAVLLSLVMCIYVYYISKKRQYPYGNIVTFKQFLSATFKALPALLTPVVLLGGIYAGIMTPTEAASVAAAYALIISIGIYRTLSLKALLKVLLNTIRTTGTIFLVIAAAYSFSYIIAAEGLSQALVKTLTSMTTSPAVFLILVNILFLILGCLVDVNVSQLVVVPLIMPLVHFYNIDLVHFGVMICLNMMIGLITPPFGMLLFITSGLGKISLKSLIKETAPYIILEIVALAIIVVFPQTVLFLTNLIK
ncbi:MAG: Sialic acid TRAP transporter permease protein SiaT [Firmicutes bacterium ADurb.Bin182]|nr:MAG: Sialic acid TRAP transporter permease protein SiaT [Firmicutes bacterium ADurb.Bin182]